MNVKQLLTLLCIIIQFLAYILVVPGKTTDHLK